MALEVGDRVFLSPKNQKGKNVLKRIECLVGIGKKLMQGNVWVWEIQDIISDGQVVYKVKPLGSNGIDLSSFARTVNSVDDPHFVVKKLIGA